MVMGLWLAICSGIKKESVMKNIFLGLVLVIAGFGCAKKNDNNTTFTNPFGFNNQSTGYTYNNGMCISTTTGQQVDPSLCASTGNNGYTYNNGMCISTTTGQQVDPSLCASTGNGGYTYNNGYCYSTMTGQYVDNSYCANSGQGGQQGGTYGGQCYGTYIFNQYNGPQQVTCYGANCRGYVLIQPSNGRPVYCQ